MHRRHALLVATDPPSVSDVQSRATVRAPALDGRTSGTHLRTRAVAEDSAPADSTGPEGVAHTEEALLRALLAHDVASALLLASTLTYLDPRNEVARRIKSRCAQNLGKKPTKELMRGNAIPRMQVPWTALMDRTLSRHAAYVLACVDGVSTVEALIDITALRPLVTYEALDGLVVSGIIAVS